MIFANPRGRRQIGLVVALIEGRKRLARAVARVALGVVSVLGRGVRILSQGRESEKKRGRDRGHEC
jgi:hypothetical protein